MERQLGQMVRLVEDLLDLNRITHNRLELRRRRVELADVVHQAVEASRPLADSLGHELRVELPRDPIWLSADPARLAQVFGNLLHNACKYTDPGGVISLTADRDGSEAVVAVRDTGIGIPPDQLEKIFEMFMQAEAEPEKSRGGLGIGLTLVKNLTELHGGSVVARSGGPGHGSEFEVRLPTVATASRDDAPVLTTDPGRAARVLVVEDNTDTRDTLRRVLELDGHQVEEAADGLEAVERAAILRPEVVLVDIGLPGLDGFEVARRLRASLGSSPLLIALTGYGQPEDRRRSRDAGFDVHLVKPVTPEQLAAALGSRGGT
jgi:CheY-like chemotaxis protein